MTRTNSSLAKPSCAETRKPASSPEGGRSRLIQASSQSRQSAPQRRRQTDAPEERADVLARVLIARFLLQEREADAFGIPPPEKVDDRKVKQPQSLAQDKEEPERRLKIAQTQDVPFKANPSTENTAVKSSRFPNRIDNVDFSFGAAFPSMGCSRTAAWTASG